MHQGGTEDAPGRHQGGTKGAPGMHQGANLEPIWSQFAATWHNLVPIWLNLVPTWGPFKTKLAASGLTLAHFGLNLERPWVHTSICPYSTVHALQYTCS